MVQNEINKREKTPKKWNEKENLNESKTELDFLDSSEHDTNTVNDDVISVALLEFGRWLKQFDQHSIPPVKKHRPKPSKQPSQQRPSIKKELLSTEQAIATST